MGIEADLSATGDDDNSNFSSDVVGFVPVTTSLSSELRWLATLRGRLGVFATPDLLVYATGGAAFGKVDQVVRVQGTPLTAVNLYGADSPTKTGWTVGGGGEWWLSPSWSIKGEYLYFDLGEASVTVRDPVQLPGVYMTYDVETTGQVARIGLNYRFSSPAPVPLK